MKRSILALIEPSPQSQTISLANSFQILFPVTAILFASLLWVRRSPGTLGDARTLARVLRI